MFAQQSYNNLRPEQKLSLAARKVSWSLPGRGNKVRPAAEKKVTVRVEEEEEVKGPTELKRKNTLTPRPPCYGMKTLTSTPQVSRRATIPNPTIPKLPNITIDKTYV